MGCGRPCLDQHHLSAPLDQHCSDAQMPTQTPSVGTERPLCPHKNALCAELGTHPISLLAPLPHSPLRSHTSCALLRNQRHDALCLAATSLPRMCACALQVSMCMFLRSPCLFRAIVDTYQNMRACTHVPSLCNHIHTHTCKTIHTCTHAHTRIHMCTAGTWPPCALSWRASCRCWRLRWRIGGARQGPPLGRWHSQRWVGRLHSHKGRVGW